MQSSFGTLHPFSGRGRGLSTAYQLSVRQTLEEFARFLEMENTGLAQPNRHLIRLFGIAAAFAGAGGMARSSMRVEMVHLRIFFRWLAGTGNTGKRPFRISGNAPAGAIASPCAG